MMKADELISLAKRKIEEISNKEGLSGVPTGFLELDKLTSGFQSSDLITIGGRPGMGKTALALSMARNMSVDYNVAVAFFSLEMASVQLITRLISSETGLSSEKLRAGKLAKHEWEQLHVKVKRLEKAPIFIDDTPEISIEDIIEKTNKFVEEYDIKVIFLDYLQLITISSKNVNVANREQEISYIIKKLKSLAKRLDMPIVLLSQLNRSVETRGGSKRPILTDYRDSGTIEEDSDIVCFLYRPEYYKIEEWDDEECSPTDGQAELNIAKHRNGGLDNIRLKFIEHIGKFDNLEKFDSLFGFSHALDSQSDLPSADEAFGSSANDDFNPDDNEVPF